MTSSLMTADDLSAQTGIPERTLAQWRYQKRGPTYLKLEGHVRYRRADVDAWLKANTQVTASSRS